MPVPSPSLDTARAPLRLASRSKINGSASNNRHSPDGYFSPASEMSFRHPFNGAAPIENAYIRRKSSQQIDSDLQDVQEDENIDPMHKWRRPNPRHDSRSPCPALNTAANHGYLPRDGRNLTMWAIIKALRECYNVSWGIAILFTVGSFVIARVGGVGEGWINPTIDLEDLAAHNVLEHNASMTHLDVEEYEAYRERNGSRSPRSRSVSSSSSSSTVIHASSTLSLFPLTPTRLIGLVRILFAFAITIVTHFIPFISAAEASAAEPPASASLYPHSPRFRTPRHSHPCAPIRPSQDLIKALFADSASGTHLTLKDIARARIRRLEECKGRSTPTPYHLMQFADAEFCLTLALFSERADEIKADIKLLEPWLKDERLPAGWKPTKEVGFWQNHLNTASLQKIMEGMKKYRSRGREVRTVAFN